MVGEEVLPQPRPYPSRSLMPSNLLAGSSPKCVQDAGTHVKMKAMRALQDVSIVRVGRVPPASMHRRMAECSGVGPREAVVGHSLLT